MSHSTIAGKFEPRVQGTGPAHALGEWLAAAAGVLRAFLSMRQATPAEIAARDAQAVRAMADSFRNTDPGFASDLYAAASRHEWAVDDVAR